MNWVRFGRESWSWEQAPIDDILFTQDNIREQFSRGSLYRTVYDSITALQNSDDPDKGFDETIRHIEVVYKNGKLHSMDNRRLFCVKEAFGNASKRELCVKKYPDILRMIARTLAQKTDCWIFQNHRSSTIM